MGTGVTLRAYAKARGISHEAVRQAIKSGRLKRSVAYDARGNPRIADDAMADEEWKANTDQSKPRNRVTGDPKHRRASKDAPHTPMANDTGSEAGKGPSYAQSRAIREAYMARLAKLEYDEKMGKLVNADEARAAIFDTARRARDMMMAVADRVAPLVVGQDDAHEIHRIITDEMRRVCAELAKLKIGAE